jgi:branched-chain amino acid transport system ATP-binding protein
MLVVRGLHAYYGKSHILQGVDLDVNAGEVVTVLGRNGVGRSTTLKAIMGEVAPMGSIRFKGREIAGLPSYRIARLGLGYVPESRDIFPGLSVLQNLTLGLKDPKRPGKWQIKDMLTMFPNLAERAAMVAGALSGGEKQMLTICRTLMGDPELIMIDEPTEGLAPLMVMKVAELISEMLRRGMSILLVEQKLTIALKISMRVYVMGHGTMVFQGKPAELNTNQVVRREWLEVQYASNPATAAP